MAFINESTPLLPELIAQVDKDTPSKSPHIQTSAIHSTNPEVPQEQQPSPASPLPSPSHGDTLRSPFYPSATILCGLLFATDVFVGGLRATSEVRLFEVGICRDYYKLRDPSKIGPPPLSYVDEADCKLDQIQVDLAYLRVWRDTFMMIPGMGHTLPKKSEASLHISIHVAKVTVFPSQV